jgi:hypothetical protein
MLEGRFRSKSGAPYVDALASLPRLGLQGLVSFMVDTGADGTVLMPTDAKRLGIDFGTLRNPTTSEGIGGAAHGFFEEVILSFYDRRSVYFYLLHVEIATPASYNQRFPSLLGRDVLKQWRCVLDTVRKKVVFTPRTWDLRQKI